MIVLGTKAEHFNAVWVRNEWSRFINMSKDTSKTVIPAYRGMSPYELPAELSVFQSQDMSKIGFMQDLTDGIERCMRIERNNESGKSGLPQFYGAASLERLLQNGATFLKLSNYSSAKEVYTTVTKEYPEEHRGWWGLIVCKTKNFSEVMLDQTKLNVWLKYVRQLATQKEFQELENQYVDYTKKVSQLAAIEDMKAVDSKISQHKSEIKNIENQIQTIYDEIDQENIRWKQRDEDECDTIKRNEEEISRKEFKKKMILTTAGVIFFFGVIVFFAVGSFSLWGILWGVIIGVIALTIWSSDDAPKNSIEAICKANKARTEHKNRRDRNIKSLKESITEAESNIAVLKEKISACRRYLELGKDKISELWFSKKCEAFGVNKSFDSQIQEYRKAALNISKEPVCDADWK